MKDNFLTAKIQDLYRLCRKYAEPRFSPFLDEAQRADAEDSGIFDADFNVMWFGGFEGAKRRMFGVFPGWEEPSEEAFGIVPVKISASFGEPLSHRDYLGSIMALGIDRSKIGDILIDGMDAYVFASGDIADYIAANIRKIGRKGVSVSKCALSEVSHAEYKFEMIDTVAASERLDAVLAAGLKLSRAEAARLIGRELVQINHRTVTDNSRILSEGDTLSVRGFGRYEYVGSGANTRSGRLHIRIKKFV